MEFLFDVGVLLPSRVGVCFLYQPGELEGGHRRPTDPVWSLEVYRQGRPVTKPDEPVLLAGWAATWLCQGRTSCGTPDTQQPQDAVLKC